MPITLSPPCNLALECIPACDALPEVQFSMCNPQVNAASVCELFISTLLNPLVNPQDLTEWVTRLTLPQADPSKIITLTGLGEKPEAEKDEVFGAFNRKDSAIKKHSVRFTVYQTADLNYEMMRYYERVKKGLVWYSTEAGIRYGGLGIQADISFNQVIPADASSIESLSGIISWDQKFHPCR